MIANLSMLREECQIEMIREIVLEETTNVTDFKPLASTVFLSFLSSQSFEVILRGKREEDK